MEEKRKNYNTTLKVDLIRKIKILAAEKIGTASQEEKQSDSHRSDGDELHPSALVSPLHLRSSWLSVAMQGPYREAGRMSRGILGPSGDFVYYPV